MSIEFLLGAYWRARRESIEQCADRLYRMFAELSACDETLATWYKRGRSRKRALQARADVGSREYLLGLLECGRHRRDSDKTVIDDLGFCIGLWNGAATVDKEVGLGVTCGLYTSNPHLGNCVVLNLPEDLGDLRHAERMAAVLTSVITAWEPDWAGVMSIAAINAGAFDAKVPFVDWMVYLSNRFVPQVPLLPPPVTVRKVEKLGCIIVVQDEPPDHATPEHLRNIEQVAAALKATVRLS